MSASQPTSVRFIPSNWTEPFDPQALFPARQPFHVDVGCGKGRFLLERARTHPEVNFLGIDRMLRRIRKIDRKAVRQQLFNIRLLRLDAYYTIAFLMPARCVQTYYIFFPDPWPKKKHHDNRLFDPAFLDALDRTLLTDGCFHFATDHLPYFHEVCEIVQQDPRFTRIETFEPTDAERSDFELMFKEKPIGRASYRRS
jgi:tRNA (guanine-N7-)-methyltransferase